MRVARYLLILFIGLILTLSSELPAITTSQSSGPLFSGSRFSSEMEKGNTAAPATHLTRLHVPSSDTNDTSQWNPPRFKDRREARHEMVEDQIKARGVNEEKVLSAMRHVPRHLFVPESRARNAYKDRPLPIGHGQTISQPFIVAFMTDEMNLDSTDKVLEVGTGSGYQAAVLSEITPHVFTIEIIDPLARQARQRLSRLGYGTIHVKAGDGYYGWKKYAPFDAIIVTAAAGHIPPPLIDQLKPGGTMVIPIGGTYEVQKLMKVRKTEEGQLRTESLMPVRFVPMTGAVQKKN